MMKTKDIQLSKSDDNYIYRLLWDFFHPNEQWGRLNRSQFFTGLVCATAYFITNSILGPVNNGVASLFYSSIGLLNAVLICAAIGIMYFITDLYNTSPSSVPWYERYMPIIITLLGLGTLIALENMNASGTHDAAIWINIVLLLTIFIITAGYFVQGTSNERVVKMWFALFGYFFSVILFFYFCEKVIFRI